MYRDWGVQLKVFNSIVDYTQMFEFGVIPKNCVTRAIVRNFIDWLKRHLCISSAITRRYVTTCYLKIWLRKPSKIWSRHCEMRNAWGYKTTADAICLNTLSQNQRTMLPLTICQWTSQQIRANSLISFRTVRLSRNSGWAKQFIHQFNKNWSLIETESGLEQDYQAASDHLQLVQNALRQQEKMNVIKRIC